MIQKCNKEHEPAFVHIFRWGDCTVDTEGLVTHSMEPAKMNILINSGYPTENPLLLIKNPYDIPRNKNPTQMGNV
jgi:hypothetical protein